MRAAIRAVLPQLLLGSPTWLRIARAASDAGVRDVWLFGSVARGDPSESSDIDLLVVTWPGDFIAISRFSKVVGGWLQSRAPHVVEFTIGAVDGMEAHGVFDEAIPLVIDGRTVKPWQRRPNLHARAALLLR